MKEKSGNLGRRASWSARRSTSVSKDAQGSGSFIETETQEAERQAADKVKVEYQQSEPSEESDELANAAEQIKASATLAEDVRFSKQLTVSNAKSIYGENIGASEIYKHFKENKDLEFDPAIIEKLMSREQAYNVLLDQAMALDPDYAQSVLDNPMIQIKKSGVISKKSEGMFNSWEERFLVLTNCGLLYFKSG